MEKDVKSELQALLDLPDEDMASRVIEYAERVKTLLPKVSPNDVAIAYELSRLAFEMFETVELLQSQQPFDKPTAEIDECYILVAHELQRLYDKYPELDKMEPFSVVKYWDTLFEDGWETKEYYLRDDENVYNNGRNGRSENQRHLSQLKRLCVINGIKEPTLTKELASLVQKCKQEIGKNTDILIKPEPASKPKWQDVIPEYKLTLTDDGTLYLNGVKKICKPQYSSAPRQLLDEVFKSPNEDITPKIDNKTRKLSQNITDLKMTGVLRSLFFPRTTKTTVFFRPVVSRKQADSEHLDTAQLDAELIAQGVKTIRNDTEGRRNDTEIDISEIPF